MLSILEGCPQLDLIWIDWGAWGLEIGVFWYYSNPSKSFSALRWWTGRYLAGWCCSSLSTCSCSDSILPKQPSHYGFISLAGLPELRLPALEPSPLSSCRRLRKGWKLKEAQPRPRPTAPPHSPARAPPHSLARAPPAARPGTRAPPLLLSSLVLRLPGFSNIFLINVSRVENRGESTV